MKKFYSTILTVFMVGLATCSFAAEIVLLTDQSRLRESELPGYNIALQKCGICHSADYVSYQPPGMSQVQWTDEMTKMRHSYGAPIDDNEIALIGAYLAVEYGSANIEDASVVALSQATQTNVAETAPNEADPQIDVQALLTANACLGCHGIDKAVVGPAFTDVAARYRKEGTVDELAQSIKIGGSGKWGPMAMPPMAGLNDAQARALADFVLDH